MVRPAGTPRRIPDHPDAPAGRNALRSPGPHVTAIGIYRSPVAVHPTLRSRECDVGPASFPYERTTPERMVHSPPAHHTHAEKPATKVSTGPLSASLAGCRSTDERPHWSVCVLPLSFRMSPFSALRQPYGKCPWEFRCIGARLKQEIIARDATRIAERRVSGIKSGLSKCESIQQNDDRLVPPISFRVAISPPVGRSPARRSRLNWFEEGIDQIVGRLSRGEYPNSHFQQPANHS